MLCQNCLRQSACLAHQLAKTDRRLYILLEQLKRCEVRQTN